MRLTSAQMRVVQFCARECELQQSGELSVYHMLGGWDYASIRFDDSVTEEDILRLGAIVEPRCNLSGYRQTGVRVGSDVKGDWRLVPGQLGKLVTAQSDIEPAEWFRLYEEIHPFRDGNGRTGQILFNWLQGTLNEPAWAPDFWGDPRRTEGWGAPEGAEGDRMTKHLGASASKRYESHAAAVRAVTADYEKRTPRG